MVSWSIDEVCQWLFHHGFDKYSPTFRNEEIDGFALIHLRDEEIFKLLTLIDKNEIRRIPSSKLQREFRRKIDELKEKIPNEKIIKSKDQKSKTLVMKCSDLKLKFFQSRSIVLHLQKYFQIELKSSSIVDSEIELIGTKENLSVAFRQIQSIFSSIEQHIFNDGNLDKKIRKYSKEIYSESSFVVLQKIFLQKNRLTLWEKTNLIGGDFRVFYLRGNDLFQSSIDFIRQTLNSEVTMKKDFIRLDFSSMSNEFDRYRQIKSNSSTMTIISLSNPFKNEVQMIFFGLKSSIRLAKKELNSLINKFQLKTIQLDLNFSEREFLLDRCEKQLKQIELDYPSSQISIRQNSFSSPKFLVETIRNSIYSLIDRRTTFVYSFISNSIEFNETFRIKLKRFSDNLKIETKSQSILLPNRSSKFVQNESNRFNSTFPRHRSIQIGSNSIELHSSLCISIDLEILSTIDDAQREEIPSTEQNHYFESIEGKRILFLRWSPSTTTMEKFFSSSLNQIVENVKTIRYSTTDWQKSSCRRDFLPTLIKLLSTDRFVDRSWTILFVCDQNQKDLFDDFLQSFPSNHHEGFYFPISTLTITIKGKEFIQRRKQIEDLIEEHFLRVARISRPFPIDRWNSILIDVFYQYSLDQHVLPRWKEDLELIGRISDVEKVKEKYRILSRRKISSKSKKILLSCSSNDEIRVKSLVQRLIDEDFRVQIVDVEEKTLSILSKIDQTDFILICFSSNYFKETNSQIVLERIKSSPKKFIPIVFSPFEGENCWIETIDFEESFYRIFEKEIRFRFDENLDQLIDEFRRDETFEVMNLISPSNDFDRNVEIDREEKRRIYDLKIEKIYQKEKIPSDEIDRLTNELQMVLDDSKDPSLTLSCFLDRIRRWIDKATKGAMIRGNLPPFTLTNDWNDSIFPIFDEDKEAWWKKTERELKPFDHSMSIEDDRSLFGCWINDDQFEEHFQRLIDRDRQFNLEIQREKSVKFYHSFDTYVGKGSVPWDFQHDRSVMKEYRRRVKNELPPPSKENDRSETLSQRVFNEKVRWFFQWKEGELDLNSKLVRGFLPSEKRNRHEQEKLDQLDQLTNQRWKRILTRRDEIEDKKQDHFQRFLRQKLRNLIEWKEFSPE